MSEEMNTSDTNDVNLDGLFDDDDTNLEDQQDPENTEEPGAEEDGADGDGQAAAGDNSGSVKIPYEFLGKKGEMSLSEAQAYLQKGMNYDHLNEKLVAAETKNKELQQSLSEHSEKAYAGKLIESGLSQKEAEEIAKEVFEAKRIKADSSAASAKEQEKTEFEAKQTDNFNKFFAKFPDVKVESWSEAMKEAYRKGESIIDVYKDEQLKKLETENTVLKTNKKNEEDSLGNPKSKGKKTPNDAFLEGLFG